VALPVWRGAGGMYVAMHKVQGNEVLHQANQ